MLLGGEENATKQAALGILNIENQLAVITTPDDKRRDDNEMYHAMTVDDLNKKAPFVSFCRPFVSFCRCTES